MDWMKGRKKMCKTVTNLNNGEDLSLVVWLIEDKNGEKRTETKYSKDWDEER